MSSKIDALCIVWLWMLLGGLCTSAFGQTPRDSTATPAQDSSAISYLTANSDSLLIDSLQRSSDLEVPLHYQAEDSIVLDLDGQTMWLFQDAKTKYKTQELEARRIRVEWRTNMLYAEGEWNSAGDSLEGTPVFKEGADVYYVQEIAYNMKTQKGRIKQGRTKQGADVMLTETGFRNPDNTYFVRNGKFTTCDAEHPHFYIKSSKMKLVPNDRIVSGPLYMVIADVPIPVILPFGFFPFNKDRTSGILLPTYGETVDRGFFFRGLGYYWAVSNYLDLTLTSNIFTNGSIQFNAATNYKKRYRYDGNITLQYSRERFNQPDDPDYSLNKQYFITIRHNQPINPNTRLTANVNAGSSNFLQRNSFNVQQNLQNELASSISYQQSFPRAKWSLTANLDHRQNLTSKIFTLTLPRVALTRDRFYPFKKATSLGSAWYERVGVTYNTEIQNVGTAPDSVLFGPNGWESFRNGMRHNVGVNTSLKAMKFITITPSFNYREYWYLESLEQTYAERIFDSTYTWRDDVRQQEILMTRTFTRGSLKQHEQSGFQTARDFDMGVSAGTVVYGVWQTKAVNQLAFRHTMTPSVGYSFRPDFSDSFWDVYRTVQVDPQGNMSRYSRFANGVYGGPSQGMQQAVTFSLNNQYEMKFKPKRTPTDTGKVKFKYVTLIDNFGLSASYNFAQDSFRLSDLRVAARSNLLNNLVNVNVNASFDPYAYTNTRRIDRMIWDAEGKAPRLRNASLSLSTSLKSRPPDKRRKRPLPSDPEKKKYVELYEPFQKDWSLSLSYTGNFTNVFMPEAESDGPMFKGQLVHSLSFNGGLQVTKNWGLRFFSNYDFERNKFGTTSIDITRDLHCWEMSVNVVPFGRYTRYMLTVNVKAASLKDLRLTKRREWQDSFTNSF